MAGGIPQLDAQGGVLAGGQAEAAVILGGKLRLFQPHLHGLAAAGGAQRLPGGLFQPGQSVGNRLLGLLLVGGISQDVRHDLQHRVPDAEFQPLVLRGIAVGQDVQPQRVGADRRAGGLAPPEKDGK